MAEELTDQAPEETDSEDSVAVSALPIGQIP